uniref:Maelstrom domain-containing protein n=1 Tax=Anopheles maculatus TaxID=74869 RepID=A0A182S6F4_9DIPT
MPKKNAFFYFMLEYKALEEAKGRKFKNIGEVTPFAGEMWQKMDAAKRERFFLIANQAQNATIKLEEKVQECAEKKDATKDLLQERVKRAVSRNELTKEEFYLISMGYFCRTIDDVYIPAEIGVIKYSLKCGVQEQFHIIIDHEKLPTGMAYEALHHSEGTHALPLPPHGLGVKDYDEIALKLLTFLRAENEMPMLFTAAKEASAVYSMLCDILGEHMQNRSLHICSVAELYMLLQHASVRSNQDKPALKTVHIAQKLLDDDVFSYTEGISCDYHEYRSLLIHCCLSQCIRWAYSISRDCCADMGIELIPGMHTPDQKGVPRLFNENSETISDDHSSSDNEHLNDGNMSFVSFGTHITSLPAEPGTLEDLPISIKPDGGESSKSSVVSSQVLVQQRAIPEIEACIDNTAFFTI